MIGAQNLIESCLDAGVQRVVALSTDKAAAPVNLYGATKLCSDKLFVAANRMKGGRDLRFSVVRYGNVMGSRGSVIPFFRALAERGEPLPITDLRVTRFWITLPQAVEFVISSFTQMTGGELYVPRIPSMRVTDLARAVAPDAELIEVGIRPGEKLHEEMISSEDSRRTLQLADRYVVMPTLSQWGYREPAGDPVEDGFSYTSDNNDLWLDVDQLRSMLNDLNL